MNTCSFHVCVGFLRVVFLPRNIQSVNCNWMCMLHSWILWDESCVTRGVLTHQDLYQYTSFMQFNMFIKPSTTSYWKDLKAASHVYSRGFWMIKETKLDEKRKWCPGYEGHMHLCMYVCILGSSISLLICTLTQTYLKRLNGVLMKTSSEANLIRIKHCSGLHYHLVTEAAG